MDIYIIIPAYNEAENIISVIQEIKSADLECEIIVVDDCSGDSTAELAKQSGAIALQHKVNRGQGAALRTGTEYAIIKGAGVIVHFDADGQFKAEEIQEVINPILQAEADITFGSRFMNKKSGMPWRKKNIIIPLARLVNRWFYNIKLTDPQSGFRAMSREAANIINWEQDRMAHCSEIMHQAFTNNLRVKEVPITVIYNDFGQKFSGGIRIIKDIVIGRFTKNF